MTSSDRFLPRESNISESSVYKKSVYIVTQMVVGSLQQYVPWHSKHVYTHTLTRHTCVTHDVITQDTLGIVRTVSITHLVYSGMYTTVIFF